MASGLAIDSSDVDLAVIGLNFNGNRELHLQEMRQLQDQLEYINCIQSMKFIESATIPVIKLQIDLQKISQSIQRAEKSREGRQLCNGNTQIDECMRYLGIDITFEDHNNQQLYEYEVPSPSGSPFMSGVSKINLGIQCISYIKSLCMKFQDLKPIVMILKKLLQKSHLNSPYHGGLSSYSLVLMTSTFLSTCSSNQMGKNLTEFLNYYANYFNPNATALNGSVFYPILGMSQDPMVVVDPLNQMNNTTRNAFRIREIQQVFRQAHKEIMKKLEEFKLNGDNERRDEDVIQCIINLSCAETN